MRTWGIVVAAGAGSRFGAAKHAVELDGVPLWRRAAVCLEEAGVERVVVVGDVPGGIPGGARRRDSVRRGLDVVPTDVDGVLVHDAARALATADLARRVIDRLARGDVDGVVPGVAVRDTLKEVTGEAVVRTVDRAPLVSVQTPQGFRLGALVAAHDADDEDATDDAQLLERHGGRVVTVAGEPTNLKITYPDDLAVAGALLGASR